MKSKEERRLATLLNEYQMCQASVQQLDSAVWQSAALIGLVSLGTLALVATSDSSIRVILLLGVFSTIGSFVWWSMANRWWSIQTAKIRRMRDIEDDLDVPGQTHYVDFLDNLHESRSSAPIPIPEEDPLVQNLADIHGLSIKRARVLAKLTHERAGPRDRLEWFPWATALAWGILAVIKILPISP